MFWTLLFLICLVVLGGFISYYGDLQGRRWGKKRVTWFGLRPKHTAILITSLTGAFIALLSVATLFLAVPTVREIITTGERAIRENKQLLSTQVRQKRDFNANIADLNNRLNLKTAAMNDLNAKNAALYRSNDAMQVQNVAIKRDNKTLIGKNMELQKQFYKLRQQQLQLDGLMRQEQVKVGALRAEKKNLLQDNTRAATLNREFAGQNVRLTRENDDLDKQNRQLRTDSAKLRGEWAKLQQEYNDIRQAKEASLRANDAQLAANREQVQEAVRLEGRIRELTRKQEELYTQLAGAGHTFNQAFSALRQGRLILRVGAELARRTLDAHLRPEAVRRELYALLDDASAQALRRGAVRGENGRAVRIVSKRLISLAGEQDTDEQASLNALIENIAGSDTPVAILVNAVSNTVEGEAVIVELTARAVKPIFAKDEVVASRQIDARQSVDKVVDAILDFLQNDVRNAAMQAGTIPQMDAESGLPQVGIVGPKDLVVLTDRARRLGGRVLLTATAATDLTSADPLRLNFHVSRPPEKAIP